ncbi:RusA family crossover junction endodeoxyribonuclease [Orrella marina]|uniref:Endonuclease n=1 Tax=Orrella marina TaxID=2163011 RepID=A0A2R4XEX5_9BURK|nr:RusA family crossover junction endodeoxyribonuclease [Orrella marina]AWB32362.1 endonuclease [Orrella marina]
MDHEEINRITIILPWPDSRLMPNRKNGRHWGTTQALKVKAKREGYFSALAAMNGRPLEISERVHVRVTFVAPDRRARDLDNLLACIKPQLDGIAKAVGVDDKLFRPITIDDAVDTKGEGFMIVEIG